MSRPKSCLIIGLDGAVPEVVEEYTRRGLLPNIVRLIENGAWADNCLPPLPSVTPVCWATIATGASPATHGAIASSPYEHTLPLTKVHKHAGYDSRTTQAETLWEAAERGGIDSLLVSYPTSWPPKTHGVQIGTTDTSVTDGSFGIKHQLFSTNETPGSIRIELLAHGKCLTTTLTPELDRGRWTVEEMLQQPAPNIAPFAWVADVTEDSEVILRQAGGSHKPLTKLRNGSWSDDLNVTIQTDAGPQVLRYRAKVIHASFRAKTLVMYMTRMVSTPCVSPSSMEPLIAGIAGIPSYRDYFNAPLMDQVDVDTFVEIQDMGFEWIANAVTCCQEARPCGLTCVYTVSLDTINHLYRNILEREVAVEQKAYDESEEIQRRTYEAIDRFVGMLLAAQREDSLVVLVSDHSGVPYGRPFEVKEALKRAGLQVMRDGEHGEELVLEESKAVYVSSSYVYVNLEGRNPGGIVAQEDYDSTVNKIIAALYDYTDPETGCKPVALALRKDDARLVGLCSENTGDVVVAVGRGFGKLPGDEVHGHQLPGGQYGSKAMKTLLLFAGPGIRRHCRVERPVSLKDIAPTIAHLMDFPVPRDTEGGVIYQMLAP